LKINLIVVDLDHTLIGVDSFNLYMKKKIKQGSIPALFLKLLRVLRLISLETYKKLSTAWLVKKDPSLEIHIERIKKKLNEALLSKLKTDYPSDDDKIIIMSASPHNYVKHLGEQLQLEAHGSHFNEDGAWVHLHRKGKISFLKQVFPETKFTYKYAISDSPTDSGFLSLFEQSDLIEPYQCADGD